jgi:hypothetical protein
MIVMMIKHCPYMPAPHVEACVLMKKINFRFRMDPFKIFTDSLGLSSKYTSMAYSFS